MAETEFSSTLSPLHEQNKTLALKDDVFLYAELATLRVYCKLWRLLILCQPFIVFFFPEEIYFSSVMSWLKAASTCGDDVFDENADDMSVISNEWVSNMKRRLRVHAACSVC